MKKFILSVALSVTSSGLFAQDVSLTKEETINYIQKKLKEVQEYSVDNQVLSGNTISAFGDGYIQYTTVFETNADDACFEDDQCPRDYKETTQVIQVKPLLISGIDTVQTYGSVGILKIKVVAQTAKSDTKVVSRYCEKIYRSVYSYTDYWGNPVYSQEFQGYSADCQSYSYDSKVDFFYLYFLKADPSNYSKLTKAFNHLISINKAEDDPFGE